MLPAFLQSFLAYTLIEYVIIMGLIDRVIRISLYKPEMSQEARLRLMAFELVVIGAFAVMLLIYLHHFPLASILMIACCILDTKDVWQQTARRYWNDFLEFEHFKPRQLMVPLIQTIPTSPSPDPVMKNGSIPDEQNKMTMPQQVPVPVQQHHTRSVHHLVTAPCRTLLENALSTFRSNKGRPPGLENKIEKNICSINVILQSLASTPLLAESLIREIPRVKDLGNMRDFITELGGLLSDLRRTNEPLLSTEHLLELTHSMKPPHPQTDSVEWLMWLLDVIHAGFLPPGTTDIELNMQKIKLLRAVPLAQPLLILYEPSQVPRALARMRAECLDKIDHAHGLQVSSYADPIQRLTEVEWLNHKLTNHSIIDDMFSGQVVEALHCKACHHLSVTVQPFKVLPLSIPTLHHRKNYELTLQDCMNQFSAIEKMYGSNGLQCKHCNAQRAQFNYATEPKVWPPIMRRSQFDSGVGGDSPLFHRGSVDGGFLSPIRGHVDDFDGSIFGPDIGKTTPINKPWMTPNQWLGSVGSPVFDHPQATSSPLRSYQVTDGERQSLISQLPDFLIIQLIRLAYQEGEPIKVNTPVTIPVSNLDLSGLSTERHLGGDHKSSSNGCYKYTLYAAVVHLGESSVTSGHYITFAQTNNGSWFCFDDEKVTPVNIDYEIQTRQIRENACLLHYRKVKLVC